jgi:hypothetical protein
MSFANVRSDGDLGSPANHCEHPQLQGGYTVYRVRVTGTLRRGAAETTPSDAMVTVTTSEGESFELTPIDVGNFGPNGTASVTDLVIELDEPVPSTPGPWKVVFWEYNDDDGVDATWSTLVITLDDTPPPPPPAIDLGVLGSTPISRSIPLASDEVIWLRFRIAGSADLDLGTYLDIDTRGSVIPADPESEGELPNDTAIGLYRVTGQNVAENDHEGDEGPYTSLLSFGLDGRGAFDGQHGPLDAGEYYLAIVAGDGYFFGAFDASGDSTSAGTVQVRLATNTTACPLPVITSHPHDAVASPGNRVEFAVTSPGAGRSYAWTKYGVEIPGATSRILILENVQESDAGEYQAIVSNSCGSTASDTAELTIVCMVDFDGNGQVDFFDYLDFTAAFAAEDGRADYDDNGQIDFFDYLDFMNAFSNPPCLRLPASPGGLDAAEVRPNEVLLLWNDNSSNETRFELQGAPEGEPLRTLATVGVDVTQVRLTGLNGCATYRFQVIACNEFGCSGPSRPVLALQIPGPSPLAPSNLRVCNAWETVLDLCWNDNAPNESGFEIQRSTDGVNFTTIDTTTANDHSYRDRGLSPTQTYWYRVRAADCTGRYPSAFAGPIQTRLNCRTPAAPSNFNICNNFENALDVCWSYDGTNHEAFQLQRSVAGGPFQDLVPALDRNARSYRDLNLQTGVQYAYRIRAFRCSGATNSTWAGPISSTPNCRTPAPPSNPRVTEVWSQRVQICWNDNATNETGYAIDILRPGQEWAVYRNDLSSDTTCANVESLLPSTSYRLRVYAFRPCGVSAYLYYDVRTGPASPTNLRTVDVWDNLIDIAWDANTTDVTHWTVERAAPAGEWAPIADVQEPRYRDPAVQASTDYVYRVRAFNGSGRSEYSNELPVRSGPRAPANLRVVNCWDDSVDLAWEDRSSDETGFVIEAYGGGEGWRQAGVANANDTSARIQPLSASTDYIFRVRAARGGARSTWSAEVAERTAPARPGEFAVDNITRTSAILRWTDNAVDEESFIMIVERWNGSAWVDFCTYQPVPAVAGTGGRGSRRIDNGCGDLTRGTRYRATLRAKRGNCTSGISGWIEFTTLP